MDTALITGGAGFIGSHLVRALLRRGDRVRVLDNFSTGKRENLTGVEGSLEIFEGDLRDTDLLQDVAQGVDFVYHLAAFVSVPQSMVEPQLCYDVNVTGTLNLLEAARAAGVKQVVFASSAAVYGKSQELPLREDTVSQTLSPYAAAKQASEMCSRECIRTLLIYRWLRCDSSMSTVPDSRMIQITPRWSRFSSSGCWTGKL